jgi:hypothetical protein
MIWPCEASLADRNMKLLLRFIKRAFDRVQVPGLDLLSRL